MSDRPTQRRRRPLEPAEKTVFQRMIGFRLPSADYAEWKRLQGGLTTSEFARKLLLMASANLKAQA